MLNSVGISLNAFDSTGTFVCAVSELSFVRKSAYVNLLADCGTLDVCIILSNCDRRSSIAFE